MLNLVESKALKFLKSHKLLYLQHKLRLVDSQKSRNLNLLS